MVMKVLLAILCLGLTACTDREAPPPAQRETVFDPMTETLERARGVEDTILDAADERLRQIDAQTGVQ